MIDVFDLLQFAPSFYHIADKSGRLVSFKLNRAQLYIHQRLEEQRKATGMVRALILKGRQQGCSTYVQARFLHKVLTKPGTQAFILTHHSDATRNLFDITKRYYKNLPNGLAPKATQDSHNRLTFGKPLESGYRVGTAGSGDVGRSQTNQLLHLSEYAFYQNTADIKKGLENTVADIEGTEKIKESTANGVTNDFYRDWQAAKSGQSHWQAIFVPWFWQDEYTANDDGFVPTLEEQTWLQLYGGNGLTTKHLAWRRIKLADMDGDDDQKARSFSQEYPFTDDDAFLNSITDSFINKQAVERARANTVVTDAGLVIGVDPARSGTDRSAIIRRRGRKAFDLQTWQGIDTMELAGKVKMIIDKESPQKVFIDSIGIGAGVVDRLHEMGYQHVVVGVNVAKKPRDTERYANTRAEIWATMRDWFLSDLGVDIPDSEDLQADLCGLSYKYKSTGQLLIESKEDAKKRNIRSPDCADSLALTFSYGAQITQNQIPINSAPVAARTGFT